MMHHLTCRTLHCDYYNCQLEIKKKVESVNEVKMGDLARHLTDWQK